MASQYLPCNLWNLAGDHLTMKPKSNTTSLSILISGILVAVFGLIAIYDASVVDAFKTFGDKFHYVKQQSTWLVIGVVLSLITANLPINFLKKIAPLALVATIFLLILVLIPGIGSKFLGARRWLILGPIVIQPSELLKIGLVLYLATWLEKPRDFIKFIGLILFCLFLIMLQPDLGTAIIVVGSSFLIYYISGAPVKHIGYFSVLLLSSILVLIFTSPYRINRVKTFLDPTADPLGASYHINQILYGVGSGGWTGVGLGMSRQKYAFLPEATTDSIFVIIAEEVGFLGATMFIMCLVFLLHSSFKVATKAKTTFEMLLASGVSLIFLIQIFVNLSSMVALVPLTGVPLPFISYGGSSLVSNFIALGLLINISKKQ